MAENSGEIKKDLYKNAEVVVTPDNKIKVKDHQVDQKDSKTKVSWEVVGNRKDGSGWGTIDAGNVNKAFGGEKRALQRAEKRAEKAKAKLGFTDVDDDKTKGVTASRNRMGK